MKHRKKGRTLLIKSPAFYFYIGWIAVSILFVTQAMRIPVYDEFLSSGRFLPLVLSFLMVVFSCILAYQHFKSLEDVTYELSNSFYFFGFISLVFVYIILIPYVPFSIATLLFLCISFLFFRTLSIWKSFLLSLGLVVVIVFVFQTVFQIVFP
ncbi:tripartite tricarboxylate transporter TctB family protein [Shouchella lehensis]|uniref:Tripartite tricarboxylate transporter TctB family protein n=1 Tax=Shouchella lehensis TaxID=300825 RepID=A0A4Y7WH68_9BACI|nr:tripartite tricarboxylate transporter TctB family protein [Shouchella lehensis]